MTNWEGWLRSKNRKDIVCAVETCQHGGSCANRKCILFPVCAKPNTPQSFRDECERFLDLEYKMEIDAVIYNLGMIRMDAESQGYAGYVAVLERAIELLKGETDERKAESKEV